MRHEWQEMFFYALGETGNVSEAAEFAGISRRHAYRCRAEDQEFADRWDDCREAGVDKLEQEARRRARDGVSRNVLYQGTPVDVVREYSDTLMIFLLKAYRPEVFQDGAFDARLKALENARDAHWTRPPGTNGTGHPPALPEHGSGYQG